MKHQTQGRLMLLTATLIWGTALAAQSMGMQFVGPFTFNAARFLMGAFILVPLLIITCSIKKEQPDSAALPLQSPLKGGILCGIILFLTASLQQVGIMYTTVGKAGFITALYIVIVPLLSIFLGKPVRPYILGCIVLAIIGMYCLCIPKALSFQLGDLLILLCAFFTAVHILLIDHFSQHVHPVKLSCLQFLVCGLLSTLTAINFEMINWQGLFLAKGPLLYTGLLSCGMAYTLQAAGQKYVSPVQTVLILSMESVFSVLSGWFILKESLSLKEIIGCLLIFCAILMAQLPEALHSKTTY